MLEQLGARVAQAVAGADPSAVRLAAPELGAVPLAAAASLSSHLPFVIVRKETKDYGTGNRLEGEFSPGERVCLLEDVVTTGGASVDAIHALRGGGPRVRDGSLHRRSRGGRCGRAGACRGAAVAALSYVRVLRGLKTPAKPAWLSGSDAGVTLLTTWKRPRGEEYW